MKTKGHQHEFVVTNKNTCFGKRIARCKCGFEKDTSKIFSSNEYVPYTIKEIGVVDKERNKEFVKKYKSCPSTHGGAGYAPGSYIKDGVMVCGICGVGIEDAPPTGSRWIKNEGIWGFLGRGHWEDIFPAWIPKISS